MTDPTKEAEAFAKQYVSLECAGFEDSDPQYTAQEIEDIHAAVKFGYLKAWHTARAEAFEKFCNDLLYEFEPRSANSEAEAEVCEWLENYIEYAKAEALK